MPSFVSILFFFILITNNFFSYGNWIQIKPVFTSIYQSINIIKASRKSTTWQWQINSGAIDTSYDVDVYDIDLFETSISTIQQLHNDNRIVICYFSAGTREDWRPDKDDFDPASIGNDMPDWAGEKFLDIRSANVRSVLSARLDLAVTKGCDGVEPDNVDTYTSNTGFPLDGQDQIDFNLWLATQSHFRNLTVGLKNDRDQISSLIDDFDFSLNEECYEEDGTTECDKTMPFINQNKAVLQCEYNGNPDIFCPYFNLHCMSGLKKGYDLSHLVYKDCLKDYDHHCNIATIHLYSYSLLILLILIMYIF